MSYKNKDWLYNEYILLKKSTHEIGNEQGVSQTTIINWLKRFEIPRRSRSEANKNCENLGKFKKGHKISEETRKNMSIAQKEIGKRDYIKKIRRQNMLNNWKNKEFQNSQVQMHKEQINERHPQWKGDNASVPAFHLWLRKNTKQPNECESCGKEIEKLDLSSKTHEYTRKPEDYWYICRSCHMKHDYKMGFRKKNNKKWKTHWWDNITKENTNEHLEFIKKNHHIRTYFRHVEKLKELGFILSKS